MTNLTRGESYFNKSGHIRKVIMIQNGRITWRAINRSGNQQPMGECSKKAFGEWIGATVIEPPPDRVTLKRELIERKQSITKLQFLLNSGQIKGGAASSQEAAERRAWQLTIPNLQMLVKKAVRMGIG